MSKLTTIEIIDLIAAINDSILLKWKHQFNPNKRIQFLKTCELPPLNNRQGTLQLLHVMLAFTKEERELIRKSFAEPMETTENASKN